MSKHETLLRHRKIIEKLRNRRSMTFGEISHYLEDQSELSDYKLVMSQRTFQRDILEIRSLYNVDIRFDRREKVYYIEEEEPSDISNRMMEAFDLISALKMSQDVTQYIHFEKRKAYGIQHFNGLLHAIRNRLVIELTHQKYENDVPTKRLVEPCGLKESKGRWYLLAKEPGKETVKTFGLDRILDFDITKQLFNPQPGYNANEAFKYCFGVINPAGETPQEIILSFDPDQGKYLKSYPLHESQKTLTDNEDELRIRLYMHVTHDLVMELLSYSDSVKVIAPDDLAYEIIKCPKTSHSFHKN